MNYSIRMITAIVNASIVRARPSLWLSLLLYGVLGYNPLSGQETIKETRQDGTVVSCDVDSKGVKEGNYTETSSTGEVQVRGKYKRGEKEGQWTYYMTGGKIIETETYQNGKRHGKRVIRYPNGKVTAQIPYEQDEIAGSFAVFDDKGIPERVIRYPMKPSQVAQILGKWWPKEPIQPTFKRVPSLQPPYDAGELADEPAQQACKMLQAFRALSGVAANDIVLDPTFSKDAQHGAVLTHRLGGLSHTPSQPPDMDKAFFEAGYRGCHTSNLTMFQPNLVASLSGFMDDSDSRNVARVGHRRWMLSPELCRIGLGWAEGVAVLHVVGGEREKVPAYDLVAFPGEGAYPIQAFPDQGRHPIAWSVLVNLETFTMASKATVSMDVFALDEHFTSKEGDKRPCKTITVDDSRRGTLFIIFQPDAPIVIDKLYWVRINGIKMAKMPVKEIGYLVHILKIDPAAEVQPPPKK